MQEYTEDNAPVLPKNHRKDFEKKLSINNTKPYTKLYKIAALVIVLISITTLLATLKPKTSSGFENDMTRIETELLQKIDSTRNNINLKTIDPELLEIYDSKLNELATDYRKISEALQQHPNNIMLLEQLILNLQNRLSLLKSMESQSNSSNQKYEHHETIIL